MPDDNSQGQAPQPNSQPVFSPVSSTSPVSISSPLPQKPKKSKMGLMIIISVVVVLLVAGGVVTYLLLRENSKTTNNSSPKTTAEVLTSLGNSLKTSLKKPTNASVLVSPSSDPSTIVYKFDSKSWVTADIDSNLLTFSSTRSAETDNKSDYTIVLNYLKSQNFTETKITSASSSYSSVNEIVKYFVSKDIVCNFHNVPEADLNSIAEVKPIQYTVRVNCSTVADFQKNIKSVKPFAEVYLGMDGSKDIKNPLFGTPDTQNRATKGYKTARISISDVGVVDSSSTGEFYQTPDKTWHFFTASQDPDKIACGDYLDASDDVKKAFIGFTCWDDSTNDSSFVKQADPTFEIVPGSIGG